MTDLTPLSPAAQAVADATEILVHHGFSGREVAAAALRAAADQVVPEDFISDQCDSFDRFDAGAEYRNQEIRDQLLAIAAQLEDAND